MAASAAALLLLRRRAAAPPSLALLQPLFPGPYSKPCSPLHAAAAAASDGLPDVRRARLAPAPVPSLLRQYSSKGCAAPPQRQPTYGHAMLGPKQPSSHLLAAAASASLPDMRRLQLSPPAVLSQNRQYSNKPSSFLQAAAGTASLLDIRRVHLSLPPAPSLIRHYSKKRAQDYCTFEYNETGIVYWFLNGVLKDCNECIDKMNQALETYGKGFGLLDEGLNDQAFAMFEKGLDDILEAVVLSEKWLYHFTKTIGRLQLDMLEQNRMFCKDMEDFHETTRQHVKEMSSSVKTLKMVKKLHKHTITVGLGACLLLILTTAGIYLA